MYRKIVNVKSTRHEYNVRSLSFIYHACVHLNNYMRWCHTRRWTCIIIVVYSIRKSFATFFYYIPQFTLCKESQCNIERIFYELTKAYFAHFDRVFMCSSRKENKSKEERKPVFLLFIYNFPLLFQFFFIFFMFSVVFFFSFFLLFA